MSGIPRGYQINHTIRTITHGLQNLFTIVIHHTSPLPFSAISVNTAILHELILGAVLLTDFDITHFENLGLRLTRRQWESNEPSSAFEATLVVSSLYNELLKSYGELRENGGNEGSTEEGIHLVPTWSPETWTPTGMPEELIQNIPVDTVREKDRRCGICLDPFKVGEHVPQLRCGHLYHKKCIFSKLCCSPCSSASVRMGKKYSLTVSFELIVLMFACSAWLRFYRVCPIDLEWQYPSN